MMYPVIREPDAAEKHKLKAKYEILWELVDKWRCGQAADGGYADELAELLPDRLPVTREPNAALEP